MPKLNLDIAVSKKRKRNGADDAPILAEVKLYSLCPLWDASSESPQGRSSINRNPYRRITNRRGVPKPTALPDVPTAPKPGPSHPVATFWLLLTAAIWCRLAMLIVFGQFMNYAPLAWLTHPVYLLPWIP
jgi:hypothetical protein